MTTFCFILSSSKQPFFVHKHIVGVEQAGRKHGSFGKDYQKAEGPRIRERYGEDVLGDAEDKRKRRLRSEYCRPIWFRHSFLHDLAYR